ncbi:MAG: hypothetical protein FJ027_22395 [Candidatus Rokubacteria bacterium]|nr:hypothetical protein [Candidatus Rokubacteria bacterium]
MTVAPRERNHETRRLEIGRHQQTRAVAVPYQRLYKASREARYNGTPFIPRDLEIYEPLYLSIKAGMKGALRT